jgi:pyruvate dehydrogenase E2 component (dihydrolipoamide acetyltransferase)
MTMSHAITMPALSDTMSSGRLVKWNKKPGDAVKKGEVIAEVETDKAVMDVEAFEGGYLSGPLVAEGTEAPVGQVIGYISDDCKEVATAAAPPVAAPPVAAPPTAAAPQPAKAPDAKAGNGKATAKAAAEAPSVSPVLAASMGSVRPAALRRARPAPATPAAGPAPATPAKPAAPVAQSAIQAGPPYRIERASSLREAVARNMIACATTPSFRVTAQLPLKALIAAAQEQKYSLTLSLARACATTIVAHPLFNAAFTADGLARRERVDIGIAVDNGDGLITPVLRDVAGRSMAELAQDWKSLREKVKSRRLTPAEYSGATFYLSDLGVFSVVYAFDSIIPPGAAAILSVAAARPQGAFFTLACDHRVVFGADAARFLETLQQNLKDPGKLLA